MIKPPVLYTLHKSKCIATTILFTASHTAHLTHIKNKNLQDCYIFKKIYMIVYIMRYLIIIIVVYTDFWISLEIMDKEQGL